MTAAWFRISSSKRCSIEDITVFGDGSQTRSFCYVDDLVEGLMRMMDTPPEVTGPINLGNPAEFTVFEIAQTIIEMTGSSSQIVNLPLPEDDPKQRRPDIAAAERVLAGFPALPLRTDCRRRSHISKRSLRKENSSDEVGFSHRRCRLCRRALLQSVKRAGYLPVVVDNLSTGHESFVRWGPSCRPTLGTPRRCRSFRCPQRQRRAAFRSFRLCREIGHRPEKYYENNVDGALSLLRAMINADCGKIVFSSTCAVYGEPAIDAHPRGHTAKPVNPYGASKAMVERMLGDYASAYGMGFVALRYFNACGADPDGEIGELRDPETHLIPRAMMAIQGNSRILRCSARTMRHLMARRYATTSMSVISLTHMLQRGRSPRRREAGLFNLGTGQGLSVKQVLDAIAAETGEELGGRVGACLAIRLCSWLMPPMLGGN